MWVARNKEGNISMHQIKPIYFDEEGSKHKDWWGTLLSTGDLYGFLNEDLPWLTFENSPKEVELVAKDSLSKQLDLEYKRGICEGGKLSYMT